MKRLCAACGLILIFTVAAFGQAAPEGPAKGPPVQSPASEPEPARPLAPIYVAPYEISGGYSYRKLYQSNQTKVGLNGGYGSIEYNVFNRLGVVAEASGGVKNQGLSGDLSVYSVMVGPQVYPFKHRRKLTPFVHVLFGGNFYRNDFPAVGGFPHTVSTDTKFGYEAGGGINFVYRKHWNIRLIQADYAPTKFLGNGTQTGYRVSVGVVYRFGEKK